MQRKHLSDAADSPDLTESALSSEVIKHMLHSLDVVDHDHLQHLVVVQVLVPMVLPFPFILHLDLSFNLSLDELRDISYLAILGLLLVNLVHFPRVVLNFELCFELLRSLRLGYILQLNHVGGYPIALLLNLLYWI